MKKQPQDYHKGNQAKNKLNRALNERFCWQKQVINKLGKM